MNADTYEDARTPQESSSMFWQLLRLDAVRRSLRWSVPIALLLGILIREFSSIVAGKNGLVIRGFSMFAQDGANAQGGDANEVLHLRHGLLLNDWILPGQGLDDDE